MPRSQHVLVGTCGSADWVPASDVGLARAAQSFLALDRRPNIREVQRLLAPSAPHRSLATFHLWSLLGDPT